LLVITMERCALSIICMPLGNQSLDRLGKLAMLQLKE
jgi:hypothetical protein